MLRFDVSFSGLVPIKRVKFECKLEHESINNFKLLQASFKKMNVDQVIFKMGTVYILISLTTDGGRGQADQAEVSRQF